MQVDGQLKSAQLEEIASTSPSPAARSRVYSDITDPANAVLRFYTGTSWKLLKAGNEDVKSKSALYTLTASDEVILANANGGAFTLTLPTAVGISGKIYSVKKLDASANAVTLDGNGSETIDTLATFALTTLNETVSIISDGANWQILEHTTFFTNGNVPVTKTTAYTATYLDTVILADATSAAFQIDLPTAIGIAGKIISIKKTDATFNAVTLDANGSQTIGGSTTTTLNTQNEVLKIVSDGANWQILERYIPSVWTTFTPSGTFTTNTTYFGVWRRVGDSIDVDITLKFAGVPNSVSSNITFLPTGLTVNTAKTSFGQTTGAVIPTMNCFGHTEDVSNGNFNVITGAYNTTTTLKLYALNGANPEAFTGQVTQANPQPFDTGDFMYLKVFNTPVTGWNA